MQELVIPSNILWSDLKAESLEQFVYWLLDDLGAKDLEWRRGGTKATSADGGRDLEAVFHVPAPDGSMEPQRWWVQVKGRSKTVEPTAVQEAIYSVGNRPDVDILVIVTNTQFSNPSRDWVAEWQRQHPRPKIRLWDRDKLEGMVSKHPSVVVRSCPGALSLQGRVEALRSRFWNQLYCPSGADLDELWKARKDLEWSAAALLTMVAGELTHGDVRLRPWLGDLQPLQLLEALGLILANLPALSHRAEILGASPERIESLAAYTVTIALARIKAETVARILANPWVMSDIEEEAPQELLNYLHSAVLTRVRDELSDACMKDCSRVSGDTATTPLIQIDETYWHRFTTDSTWAPGADRRLTIEKKDEPCKVGFRVGPRNGCPLLPSRSRDRSLTKSLEIFQRVILSKIEFRNYRRAEPPRFE